MTSSPNQAGCYAVAVVLLVFSTAAVGGRLNIRRVKKTALGLDDLFIILALLLVYALCILLIYGTARGTVGTHTLQNPVTGLIMVTWHEVDISRLAFLSQMVAIATYGCLKLSVLFLFRRIFLGKTFSITSIIVTVIVSLWAVSFFFATLFQCGKRPSYLWESPKALAQHCGDYKYIQLGHATSDVATDLLVLGIPIPIIWKLHMSAQQRIGLLFVFLLGYISTAAATARVVFIVKDLYTTTEGARDLRGEETNVMVWGYVEAGVGVIAACLPTLRPLLNARMPESIMNSVRSKLSINSLRSQRTPNRPGSDINELTGSRESFELVNRAEYGNGVANITTQVERVSHSESQVPKNGIFTQHKFAVNEDRVEPAWGSAV